MAIDYFLVFDRRPDAAAVRQFLLEQGLHTIDGKLLLAAHLSACVHDAEERKLSVSFRLDKWGDHEVCSAQMFMLVAALLQRFAGDAELSFEYETTLLARCNGELQRGESASVWTLASWQSATRICEAHGMPLRGSAPEPETAE